jgi:hypothetical protein
VTSAITKLRLKLRENGYAPLPLSGKVPPMDNWTEKTDSTPDEIALWERLYPYCENTGVLTANCPAVDIDVLNPLAAAAVEEMARDIWEESGYFMVRIGRAPKRAVLLRTLTPFKKIAVSLVGPDGNSGQKVEVLAAGQQVVVAGRHPDTGRDYVWHGGDPGNIPQEDLPYVSAEQAALFVKNAADLLTSDFGYTRPAKPRNDADAAQPGAGHADWAGLIASIAAGTNLHDNIRDLAAKLIASGMADGAAVNLIRAALECSSAPKDARFAERLADVPRAVAGARQKFSPKPQPQKPPDDASPKPFIWTDPAALPRRRWLYGRHYIRRYATCTVGTAGHGKTTLAVVEALAIAIGRPLLGIQPEEQTKVWLWNGEDPLDELNLRIEAAMLHHGITPDKIAGQLFVNGRESRIVIAEQTRAGTVIAQPVVDRLIGDIKAAGIGAVVIDPMIKSHRVGENDNAAVDVVVGEWNAVAEATGTAIELLHHTRKSGAARSGDLTIDDARGASALISASRSARILNRMTKEDAANLGIPEPTAWRYFRIDNGKASMAPAPDKADWYCLASVDMANGDSVGVAAVWNRPKPFDEISVADLRAAQAAVHAGGPWRANFQADAWVGKPIAEALKIDISQPETRERIKIVLATWIKNGMFVEVPGRDDRRHFVKFVEVGTWAE